MDRRVTITARNVVKDSGGRETVTWVERSTRWANKRPISGGEQMRAGQISPDALFDFTFRWADGLVVETDRLTCEGSTFEVLHIAEMGRREGLRVRARSVLP